MIESEVPSPDHILSNKTYDRLKLFCLIVLPLWAILYFVVAKIWDLEGTEDVLAIVMFLVMCLGLFLQMCSVSYDKSEARYAGTIDIIYVDNEKKTYTLNLNYEPSEIENRDQIVFKVNAPSF